MKMTGSEFERCLAAMEEETVINVPDLTVEDINSIGLIEE